MRTTITRIILAVLAVATVSAITTPSASAGSDLPSGHGVIPDTVMVSGTYEATGYTGGFFDRDRISETGAFIGSAQFAAGDRPERLSWVEACVGDLPFAATTEARDRRDDGSVEVLLIVWTFGGCPHRNQHGFGQRVARVSPGESVDLEVFARNSNGAVTVSATFTNVWTPKLDVTRLVRPHLDLDDLYRFDLGPSRVATSAFATEEPQIAKTPKIDTSTVEVTVVTVPVPTPPVTAEAATDESSASEGVDLTDLTVVVDLPTIAIPIGSSFDF